MALHWFQSSGQCLCNSKLQRSTLCSSSAMAFRLSAKAAPPKQACRITSASSPITACLTMVSQALRRASTEGVEAGAIEDVSKVMVSLKRSYTTFSSESNLKV